MSYTKQSLHIAGIHTHVYHASTSPSLPIAVLFLLHGRLSDHKAIEFIIDALFTYQTKRQTENVKRELWIVAFDQRNHGERMVCSHANKGWSTKPEENNATHGLDMYAIQTGTAVDVSTLIDYLPAYLFPAEERTIDKWMVAGVSLGGHSTWIALKNDPRLSLGVPMIGCPDFLTLMKPRAEKNKQHMASAFPKAFLHFVQTHDPAFCRFDDESGANPYFHKDVLVLSGGKDKLVPWSATDDFYKRLCLGQGFKDKWIDPSAGHEITPGMVQKMNKFLWNRVFSGSESRL